MRFCDATDSGNAMLNLALNVFSGPKTYPDASTVARRGRYTFNKPPLRVL
jgi:hypothetical protein